MKTQSALPKPALWFLTLALSCSFLGLLGAALPAAAAAAPGSSGERTPAAEARPESDTAQRLEAIRKKKDLPALAVVVVKDGRICERAAVGVRKQGAPTPVTTNDLFHIGSCTKPMTATLVARCIEMGKLRWDTTIAEVFPEFRQQMDPRYQTVTVEQLLTHRGGLPGEPPPAAWERAQARAGTVRQQRYEFLQTVLTNAPAATPGTQYIYSNQGYTLLGAMLEKLTDTPWETLMTNLLFKPLHMASAGFGAPGTAGQVDQPWGHARQLGLTLSVQMDNPPAIGPAGRVHCSLEDLAAFILCHLEGERKGGLLKPETFHRLHTAAPGGTYACGWVCTPRRWAGGQALMHTGSNTTWYLVMWLAPQKDFAVVAATNIGAANAFSGCDEAASAMIDKWLQP